MMAARLYTAAGRLVDRVPVNAGAPVTVLVYNGRFFLLNENSPKEGEGPDYYSVSGMVVPVSGGVGNGVPDMPDLPDG